MVIFRMRRPYGRILNSFNNNFLYFILEDKSTVKEGEMLYLRKRMKQKERVDKWSGVVLAWYGVISVNNRKN